ncbi:MAG: cyclase [Flavobacterium sp. BFFFF1]|uniref:SRPBCC family protein n=1 Tax=Flavobacterium sp. BFFFF1 TaxID=2015557 RepID=UPI000BDA7EA7|nr:SRPBCC family protein [Flavobacterium sp. BFFFF1]OYU81261.1 MAG: cyclase [Flavobacterium sp. BFFFF1]
MKTDHTTPGPKLQSKIDKSGTDPNRYSAFYSEEDAHRLGNVSHKSKQTIKGIESNVSTLERVLMIAGGSYLLYKALAGRKKSVVKGIAGGTMLARGISGYCPLYQAVGKSGFLKTSNINIRTSMSIDKPVSEVYAFWRNLENLPRFMKHLETVKEINKTTSHWCVKVPGGIGHISWTANILMDEKDEMLSWKSVPGSTIDNGGKIVFTENGRGGTDLDINISYHAPLGIAGDVAAKLLNGFFERMVHTDIENVKSYMESGQHTLAE